MYSDTVPQIRTQHGAESVPNKSPVYVSLSRGGDDTLRNGDERRLL